MLTKGDTFVTLFDKACASHPDDECYISYDGKLDRKAITFGELRTLASRFAFNLKQYDLQRGDYVIVATPSSLEYIVASFGVILAGGIQVSMEKLFSNCEALKKTIKLCKAKFILMTDSVENNTWPFFESHATVQGDQSKPNVVTYNDASLPSLKKIVFTNNMEGAHSSETFLNHLRSCSNEFRDHTLDPEGGCVCTSSVNQDLATPKLVELSHRAVVNMAGLYKTFSEFGKIYMNWPWYIAVTLPYDALNGVARVIPDTYSKMTISFVEHFLKVVELEDICGGLMSPHGLRSLTEVYQTSDKKLLKHLMVGGQPVTKAVFEAAQKIATNVHVLYVISETNHVSTNILTPTDSFDSFDCGVPLEGVEVKIVDYENKELDIGETGRIAIRSPYLFTRYPGQPALTKSVMGKDGWFYSNDAGCIKPDGHLHVYGRRGDVISRGITLIYPTWIEKPIMDIPDVMRVTAVGVPDEINIQNTCACVTIRPDSQMTEEDIHRIYSDTVIGLGSVSFPLDNVIIFDGALPKMTRQELGDLAAEKLKSRLENA